MLASAPSAAPPLQYVDAPQFVEETLNWVFLRDNVYALTRTAIWVANIASVTPEWSVWFLIPAHLRHPRDVRVPSQQPQRYGFERLYASTTRLFALVSWSSSAEDRADASKVGGYTNVCMVDEAGPHPGVIPAFNLMELRIEGEDFFARKGSVVYDCDPDGVIRASHTFGESSITSKTADGLTHHTPLPGVEDPPGARYHRFREGCMVFATGTRFVAYYFATREVVVSNEGSFLGGNSLTAWRRASAACL